MNSFPSHNNKNNLTEVKWDPDFGGLLENEFRCLRNLSDGKKYSHFF